MIKTHTLRMGPGEPLALIQAEAVAAPLRALGAEVGIVPVRNEGDRRGEIQLAAIDGKGLFVREIEEMLLAGALDCAVHSLKDLPAEVPAGLTLAAFPEREDPRDALVTRERRRFEDLRTGARLGTGSPRRCALVLALRPDLVVEPVRGNVGTRLRKLETEDWDGMLLAAAGLKRRGLNPEHVQPLAPEVFVPAVGQGILAVEARVDDRDILALLERLDHVETRAAALAERAYLRRLGASCNSPVAAHAAPASQATDGRPRREPDERKVLRASAERSVREPEGWLAARRTLLDQRRPGGLKPSRDGADNPREDRSAARKPHHRRHTSAGPSAPVRSAPEPPEPVFSKRQRSSSSPQLPDPLHGAAELETFTWSSSRA